MDPGPASLPCVACGTLTPRAEMFGAAPDLRCEPCAERLRHRTDPRSVRRAPTTFTPAARDPRATGTLIATMVVLWFGWNVLPAIQEHLQDVVGMWREGPFWMVARRPDPWSIAVRAVLHIDLWHLILNGLALYQAGRWIELGWGPRMVFYLVLGGAISGVAAGWLLNGAPTIGLSGGIFTLDGWLLMLRRHHVVASAIVNRVFIHALLASTVLMVVLTEVGGMPISHVGHAAGFLFGLEAGWCARLRRPVRLYVLLALVPLGLCLLCSQVAPLDLPLTLFGKR